MLNSGNFIGARRNCVAHCATPAGKISAKRFVLPIVVEKETFCKKKVFINRYSFAGDETPKKPGQAAAKNVLALGYTGSSSLRRMEVDKGLVSRQSILSKLRLHFCLNLRQLAALHGVDTANESLVTAVADLKRNGHIQPTGGQGRHTSFVLATFDTRV